ncbi:MAG: DNA repair protein RecO [Planctomycetota bacterium]|jgi:DNA repair protein RecO (recombination protein O)|nr:DNA repair protein RecO [Planctomycetota bacterium]MDA1025092.1 DNA repair protein RecO [Planctomycetota bacterium]
MPTLCDEAVCVRHWDFSETSQTVSLFLRDHGILRGLAKGARRERGSFSGGFDLFTRGEIVAIVKPGRELATLTEWTLLETFPILRRQAPANRCGWYLADLVGRFLHQPEPHPKTWDAMITALRELDAGCSTDRVILAFHWRLLCDLGYRPRLDLTGFSGETVAFSAESGGVVADTGAADRWRVRRPTIELLIKVGEGDGMIPDGADPDTTARANRLLATWIRELLGTESVPMRLLFGS